MVRDARSKLIPQPYQMTTRDLYTEYRRRYRMYRAAINARGFCRRGEHIRDEILRPFVLVLDRLAIELWARRDLANAEPYVDLLEDKMTQKYEELKNMSVAAWKESLSSDPAIFFDARAPALAADVPLAGCVGVWQDVCISSPGRWQKSRQAF